jgi:regulator of protease activity HflC (stomatin/prohibitin superfamily)
MSEKSMKPVIIGVAVAAAIIVAFFAGREVYQEQNAGPAERLGEALDKAAKDIEGAVKANQ